MSVDHLHISCLMTAALLDDVPRMNRRHYLVTIQWHGVERDEDHNNLVHAAIDDETFSIATIPMAVCFSVTDLWQHTELKQS